VSPGAGDAGAVAVAPGGRFDRLDALRGVAIVWMALFHLCFDLNHFGFWTPKQAFTADPFWTTQRTAIVSLFLFCAGMGQAIALEQGQSWARFWRRWAQIAACAPPTTSYVMRSAPAPTSIPCIGGCCSWRSRNSA